jgi:hypothetical protein
MISRMHRWFVEHPRSVGESYAEHCVVAARFGLSMVAGGFGCLVHAVFPALFERTGSSAVKTLYGEMLAREPGTQGPAHEEPEWQLEYEI